MARPLEYNVTTENGFGALVSSSDESDVGYGYFGSDEGDFEVVKRKRKRRDTGGAKTFLNQFDSASLDTKLSLIFEDLQVLKSGQKDINKGMSTFKNTMDTTREKVDGVINVTNSNVSLLKLLSYKSIDIEARSRRNNLIIRGVPEERNENCFHTVRRFIYEELSLDSDRMFLVRAHRLGARRRGIRPFEPQKRPLIVAFRDYNDTVEILSYTKRLKGTLFSVDRDYPREIYDARKRLWPLLKENRNQHPKADVNIQYPARLMVDKVVIRDEFPDWFPVLNGMRTVTVSNVELLEKQSTSSSIFPKVPLGMRNKTSQKQGRVSESINEPAFYSGIPASRDSLTTTATNMTGSNKTVSHVSSNSAEMSEPVSIPASVPMTALESTSVVTSRTVTAQKTSVQVTSPNEVSASGSTTFTIMSPNAHVSFSVSFNVNVSATADDDNINIIINVSRYVNVSVTVDGIIINVSLYVNVSATVSGININVSVNVNVSAAVTCIGTYTNLSIYVIISINVSVSISVSISVSVSVNVRRLPEHHD